MLHVAPANRRPNIIYQHLANVLQPVVLMQKILAQDHGGHLRHVFMLRNGGYLRFRKSTKCNAIFEGNHLHPVDDSIGPKTTVCQMPNQVELICIKGAHCVAAIPENATLVLLDDIVSSGATLLETLRLLKRRDGRSPIAIAIHGLHEASSEAALTRAGARPVTTNSVPNPAAQIDVIPLIAKGVAELLTASA